MIILKKSFIASIVAMTFLSPAIAQTNQQTCETTLSNSKADQLIKILCHAKEQNKLKAVMFGAWINGKEVLVTSLGDSMTTVAATKDMHFRTGGASFTFLTTLLLQLVDEGKITLQDKLSNWFPNLPHANEITLDMLVRSTSGYYDYVASKNFTQQVEENPFREWTQEEIINIGVSQPLSFAPGKGWEYSHTNYVILARVLEKITGKLLPALLKEKIFNKVHLRNTAFPLTPDIQPPVLHTYTSERGIYEDSTFWNPSWVGHSARLTSNLPDLGKWLDAFGNGKLISQKSFQTMIAPTTVGLATNKPDAYYGMGVIIINSWIFQNPSFAGFTGVIAYLPAKKIAIYINTTNEDIKNREDAHYAMSIFKEVTKYLAPEYAIP